jgi:beta-galactosidase
LAANKHWENPELQGYGRLPPRSTFDHADTISLNGAWRFKRYAFPADVPSSWYQPALKDQNWQTIEVPSLWTMNPDVPEDQPIYTNVLMPYKTELPYAPTLNPTAVYRRTIDVPNRWQKKRVVIYLGGVENCFYLYCNGKEVGFSKDCRLPTEFDLTDYLHVGTNSLAIQVLRFSDSSYIEDQDQWWQAGIHREVKLYATNAVYLRDIFAQPAFVPSTKKGHLVVEVQLGDHNRSSLNHSVEISITGPGIKQPKSQRLQMNKSAFFPVVGKGPTLRFEIPMGKVKAWNAETPHLYDLTINLIGEEARSLESTTQRVGFRDIRIHDRELLINDAPVLIRGVNRHDHCDTTGKVMSEALLRLDIETMKQHNINAIRTSHYPNDPLFYQLCDEYGMYVVDECNLEAHHHYAQVGVDPFWASAFLSRITRMVVRDKNHPCIIMWSMGNETGFGPNHAAMAAWVKSYDPTRPIHNESAICEQAVADRWNENHHGTDVVCPMYPSVQQIIDHAVANTDSRPLIMCEFAHAMGNSCGNLKEYWEAIESNHGLQGGFIWEWLDHGIKQKKDGADYWAYGGDFGEERHDLNFVCDGLCWPDRTPHSSLLEYKKVIQPITVAKLSKRRFRIENRDYFTDLRQYEGQWHLILNGYKQKSGKVTGLNADAQQSQLFELPASASRTLDKIEAGDHVSILFEFTLKSDTRWAKKGHLVAYDQHVLAHKKSPKKRSLALGEALITTQPQLRFGGNTISFSDAGIASWTHGKTVIMQTGPALNIWRAPTDNDGIKGWTGQTNKALGRWQDAGLDQPSYEYLPLEFTTKQVISRTIMKFKPGNIVMLSRYGLSADGELLVQHEFDIDKALPDLPRIGVRMILPGSFEKFSWFGRGPVETYCDRKSTGVVQRHESSVSDQYVPYILPQEHGNHTDVNELDLIGRRHSLSIIAATAIEASASHYPHEQLTPAFHTYDLAPDKSTFLSLDVKQRGLGGASCGPDTLPQYLVDEAHYKLEYRIKVNYDA